MKALYLTLCLASISSCSTSERPYYLKCDYKERVLAGPMRGTTSSQSVAFYVPNGGDRPQMNEGTGWTDCQMHCSLQITKDVLAYTYMYANSFERGRGDLKVRLADGRIQGHSSGSDDVFKPGTPTPFAKEANGACKRSADNPTTIPLKQLRSQR